MDKMLLYQSTFERAGMRMTDQRMVICAWLAGTDLHPTPYDVYQGVAQTHPEISRATVYNTLNTLQQLGAIVEISMGADETHYDTNPTPHVNLICLRCHKVIDLHVEPSSAGAMPWLDDKAEEALKARILHFTGFRAFSARTDVMGLCAECAANEEVES